MNLPSLHVGGGGIDTVKIVFGDSVISTGTLTGKILVSGPFGLAPINSYTPADTNFSLKPGDYVSYYVVFYALGRAENVTGTITITENSTNVPSPIVVY